MYRASRPDLRSRRRSRRRQAVLACGGLSYCAAVASGDLGLLSLVAHTGVIALAALWLATALAAVGIALLMLDALLARRSDRARPPALL